MKFWKIVIAIPVLCVLLLIVYITLNSIFISREEVATLSVEEILFELSIDFNLFKGPILVEKHPTYSVFRFISKVPNPGDAIIELSVGDNVHRVNLYDTYGKRESLKCFRGTDDFPLNEAILSNLFSLPPTPKIENERTKRLRKAPLSLYQIECIADFLEIKRQLMEHFFETFQEYPDDLGIFDLDSLYTTDELGRDYYYENLNSFVILGTPGENGEWDFDNVVLDSLYNDDRELILLNGDDILVKFMPVYQ